MRFAAPVDSLQVRTGVLVLVVVVALAIGAWRRRVDGRARSVSSGERLTAADVGATLGQRATLLQFSAPVCAPCRAARRVLSAVAETAPGVVHVELDAGEHLDLARRLGVLRTPTVLVLGPDGQVVARTSGVPTHPQVEQALTLAAA